MDCFRKPGRLHVGAAKALQNVAFRGAYTEGGNLMTVLRYLLIPSCPGQLPGAATANDHKRGLRSIGTYCVTVVEATSPKTRPLIL